MKKLVLMLMSAFFLFSTTFAYTPKQLEQKTQTIQALVKVILHKNPEYQPILEMLFSTCASSHSQELMRAVCRRVAGLPEPAIVPAISEEAKGESKGTSLSEGKSPIAEGERHVYTESQVREIVADALAQKEAEAKRIEEEKKAELEKRSREAIEQCLKENQNLQEPNKSDHTASFGEYPLSRRPLSTRCFFG